MSVKLTSVSIEQRTSARCNSLVEERIERVLRDVSIEQRTSARCNLLGRVTT